VVKLQRLIVLALVLSLLAVSCSTHNKSAEPPPIESVIPANMEVTPEEAPPVSVEPGLP
jgi:hypothetical protein